MSNRYVIEREIDGCGENWYRGMDLSLNRPVLLYEVESRPEADPYETIRGIGEISAMADEHFMHMLDVERHDDRQVLAVMKPLDGGPLTKYIHRLEISSTAKFYLLRTLGTSVLRMQSETELPFAVTAQNLWLDHERLVVMNCWAVGGEGQTGPAGFCRLLFQLCVRSLSVPLSEIEFERRLMESLPLIGGEAKALLSELIRTYFFVDDSAILIDFMADFNRFLQTHVDPEQPLTPKPTAPQPLQASESDPEVDSKRRGKLVLVLCIAAASLVAAFFVGYGAASLIGGQNPVARGQRSAHANASGQSSSAGLLPNGNNAGSQAKGGTGGNEANSGKPGKQMNSSGSVSGKTPAADSGTSGNQSNSSGAGTQSSQSSGVAGQSAGAVPGAPSGDTSAPASASGQQGKAAPIPNLIGLTLKKAENLCLAKHFHYKYFKLNNNQPKGTVYKQQPAAGTPAHQEDRITFWVSKGPPQ